MKREISIAGGGLCGLSLGIALRQHDIDVTVYEAGSYPRHRVCGEFICGLEQTTIDRLGLQQLFADKPRYDRAAWFCKNKEVTRNHLPESAWAISRYRMDDWLQQEFTNTGGLLKTNSRRKRHAEEGLVWTAGRRPAKSEWIGLKTHIKDYTLGEPLEMHLGQSGYAGIIEVEDGWLNICGLFKRRPELKGRNEDLMANYLEACQLTELANAFKDSTKRPDAFSAVAGFHIGSQANEDKLLVLGDADRLIPPFTGNGMSMAFEAADCAVSPIVAYATGDCSWHEAQQSIDRSLKKRFSSRMATALTCHPFLTSSFGQISISTLASLNLLPFRTLFALSR